MHKNPIRDKFTASIITNNLDSLKETIESKEININADYEFENSEAMTALHWAAGTGNEKMLKLLINFGADTNAATSECINSPLILALYNGSSKTARILIENTSTNVRAQDHDGCRAYDLIESKNSDEIKSELTESQKNVLKVSYTIKELAMCFSLLYLIGQGNADPLKSFANDFPEFIEPTENHFTTTATEAINDFIAIPGVRKMAFRILKNYIDSPDHQILRNSQEQVLDYVMQGKNPLIAAIEKGNTKLAKQISGLYPDFLHIPPHSAVFIDTPLMYTYLRIMKYGNIEQMYRFNEILDREKEYRSDLAQTRDELKQFTEGTQGLHHDKDVIDTIFQFISSFPCEIDYILGSFNGINQIQESAYEEYVSKGLEIIGGDDNSCES